ncbi:hypothetical protein BKA82DRAFT_4020854 [Pisolithus tinctorius]|nr:hypothetical protein BKA82DRAFT_4020854 [Pisolithus tinctorius]
MAVKRYWTREGFIYIPELKTNRQNWKEYHMKILEVMQIQNVDQVLVGMKPKPRPGSNELKEWLKSSGTTDSILMWNMPNSILSCIKYYETAHEMFNYLETTYGDPNPTSIPVKCISAPAEQLNIGKDEPKGTNGNEPPKEVRLEGNSHDEVRSSDEVKAEATVEVAQAKSAEVEGKMSREVSKERAAESSLGKEATDKADSMDITAKKTTNLEADGGDTEVHHTSNGLECMHERKAHASAQDTPNDSQTTGNTKDMGGSTDALQHHTGDPGHHTHERSTHASAQDLPISPQAPAEHPREGVGTTAVKQHAVGEMSCNELDGHAEPKVAAEQHKCEAIEPAPDLILQMEVHATKNLLQTPTKHSQPKLPMTNYVLESPTEQGQVPLKGEYGGNTSNYANGQNTSGKDLRGHMNKLAGSKTHQCTITKMLEVSRVSSRTVKNGKDAPKVGAQPVKAENDQDSSSGRNTGSCGVEDAPLPMAGTQCTYRDTLNRPKPHSSAPGGAGLHVEQGCTLAITNKTCRCQYTPEECPKEGIGTMAVEKHAVGSREVQEVKKLQNEHNHALARPQEFYVHWHMLGSTPDDSREPEVHGGTETSQPPKGGQ